LNNQDNAPRVISFDASAPATISEVGGKGLSLMMMTQQQLPVPRGFILTETFFRPWLERIWESLQWQQALTAPPDELANSLAAVKSDFGSVDVVEADYSEIAQALENLSSTSQTELFAVRSSSPEEDLEGASFAGGYETVLGVNSSSLSEAIRHCAFSCLSERVIAYKRAHGFNVARPSIAVIVQAQLAADTAGVAFSLNPLNNCYDEVVINANFGLGESVVSGSVSPDQFVVDKPSQLIRERQIGSKQTAVWLLPGGNTEQRPNERPHTACLSDTQIVEVTQLASTVEEMFGKPVDIEWAFAGEQLHLLQARPITAYFPLPEEMRTKPGQRKQLYLDGTLAKQGLHKPLSPLGADFFARFTAKLSVCFTGNKSLIDFEEGLGFLVAGRLYTNLSRALKLSGKQKVESTWRMTDTISADIIRAIDMNEYKSKSLSIAIKTIPLRFLIYHRSGIWNALRGILNPEKFDTEYRSEMAALEQELATLAKDTDLSLSELVDRCNQVFVPYLERYGMATFYAAEWARLRIKRIFRKSPDDTRTRIVYLERALPENCTIVMGLAMFELARLPDIQACADADDFVKRLESRSLSSEFLSAWDNFMHNYGHRCPEEIDVAAPRYYEMPRQVYDMLRVMASNTNEETSPQAIFDHGVQEREQAYEFLRSEARRTGKRQERALAKNYKTLLTFGRYREVHKYYWVRTIETIRRRALALGQSLYQAGCLDRPEDVFNLLIEQIDQGMHNSEMNLRRLMEGNVDYLKKFRHVREFPRIIDSRGKILRPPAKQAREGELQGEAISPGVVRGKAKILNHPGEKPLLPGEILVARATDPGWTPLFLNANGVVLEVGGLLQHGALVARESCKPCVAGVDNVASLLKDGQLVEIDGTSGTIRILAEPEKAVPNL